MDLFEKGEAKESLTEHLYTIIHQNEVRKAKKLVELMEKLTMEVRRVGNTFFPDINLFVPVSVDMKGNLLICYLSLQHIFNSKISLHVKYVSIAGIR